MGYTHYWAYPPSHPRYAEEWPRLVQDTRVILDRIQRAGITIAGPAGHGEAILNQRTRIAFNGPAGDDDHDTFALLPPLPAPPQGTPVATAFCKTNRAPYDLAVTAVLLHCHLLLPDLFHINSDGTWDKEWARGAAPEDPTLPADPLNPRDLVADLFHTTAATSPLQRLDVSLDAFRGFIQPDPADGSPS